MKKININKVPVTTFILFLICVIITAALAGTNYITKPRIEKLELKAQEEAKLDILPGEYQEKTISYENEEYSYTVVKEDEALKGYIITVDEKGYGGDIKVMVGMDTSKKITAVKVLSASDETPGLGQKVAGKSFYSGYKDKTAGNTDVDTITGATISSKAVNRAVAKATDILSLAAKNEGEAK